MVILDTLPGPKAKVRVDYLSPGCAYNGAAHTVTCLEPLLPVGETASFEIKLRVWRSLHVVVNQAEISSDATDSYPSNNEDVCTAPYFTRRVKHGCE